MLFDVVLGVSWYLVVFWFMLCCALVLLFSFVGCCLHLVGFVALRLLLFDCVVFCFNLLICDSVFG